MLLKENYKKCTYVMLGLQDSIILFVLFILFLLFGHANIGCAKKNHLNIITFNIRYENKGDGVNSWANRNGYLCEFLRKQQADIVCLQEVLHHQLHDVVASLSEYSYCGVGRNDGKTKGEYAPVFYKKSIFEEIEHGTFWLSDHPDLVGSIGWDAKQPRIVTWVILRIKKSGDSIVVFNTHLDDIGKKARVESVKLIMEKISHCSLPVILTGDFNESPRSKAYQIITDNQNGMMDTDVNNNKRRGVFYTFHNFGKIPLKRRIKIDYVFVKGIKKVKKVIIPQETSVRGIYLSDHNPIIADLII